MSKTKRKRKTRRQKVRAGKKGRSPRVDGTVHLKTAPFPGGRFKPSIEVLKVEAERVEVDGGTVDERGGMPVAEVCARCFGKGGYEAEKRGLVPGDTFQLDDQDVKVLRAWENYEAAAALDPALREFSKHESMDGKDLFGERCYSLVVNDKMLLMFAGQVERTLAASGWVMCECGTYLAKPDDRVLRAQRSGLTSAKKQQMKRLNEEAKSNPLVLIDAAATTHYDIEHPSQADFLRVRRGWAKAGETHLFDCAECDYRLGVLKP